MPPESDEILSRLHSALGSVVEVWVADTELRDWTAAVEALQSKGYHIEFHKGGSPTDEPLTTDLFTDEREEGGAYDMYVTIGDCHWWTGLFSTSLIDFQGRPEWITSEQELGDITDFMQVLADATRKEAIFIPETLTGDVKRYMTRSPRN
ncbi:hypothetical protein [Streptomyces sp. NPDC046685]|uniref:hypothetical protein n=1 Tax=Streptomyces sp. NPDC046685 TaxID=3157202 RepID=UPI0033E8BCBF